MARTHSPTLQFVAGSEAYRGQAVGIDFEKCNIAGFVGTDDLRLVLPAVTQASQ